VNQRIVVLHGWRAYALAALVLAVLVAVLMIASVIALTLVAAGIVAFVGYRALRALGLIRPAPRRTRTPGGAIEGEYRVVERPLPDPSSPAAD
jgi:hypothetical protein